MTVIAAVANESYVVMGCDAAAMNSANSYMYKREGKIAELHADDGDPVLIGVSGNASILPVLQRSLTIEQTPHDGDDPDEWADAIAVAITGILADTNPSLLVTGDGAPYIDGSILLACHEHLWLVHTNATIRPHNNMAAIGSGGEVATGALAATLKHGGGPYEAVTTAVEASCTFADGCRLDDRGPLIHHT
ncbi:hypothetical protein [Prescottella agglutinans]|uniref:ATP-dependent protease HslVU (ClpYQ) peptidase subunit n=1 Tax=Prescottella agglutinans TaxID=1644129 RepID=A0ABT6MES7_9NOCA|nr:hypothetical protein [Prescottella agglutinans]MDH6282827.1 ATP-dependent protease HslVU (ClpYQ) peptidase subunit [Prescottella agglutinans]